MDLSELIHVSDSGIRTIKCLFSGYGMTGAVLSEPGWHSLLCLTATSIAFQGLFGSILSVINTCLFQCSNFPGMLCYTGPHFF